MPAAKGKSKGNGSGRGKPKKGKCTVLVKMPESEEKAELPMSTIDTVLDLRKLVQQDIDSRDPDLDDEEENRWEKLILLHGDVELKDNEFYIGNLEFTEETGLFVTANVPKPPGGNGRFEFPSGALYDGAWEVFKRKKRRHGVGKFSHGGEEYEGEWVEGVIQGKGTYTFAGGAQYKGEWAAAKMQGKGTYQWPGGAIYQGQWENNMMQGQGTFTTAAGDVFKGKFVANKFINEEGHWVPEGSWPEPPVPETPEDF